MIRKSFIIKSIFWEMQSFFLLLYEYNYHNVSINPFFFLLYKVN